jgi:serine/threonine-protein kinase
VPRGLADVVERCMRKDPAARFQDAAELAEALLPFAPARAIAVVERSCSTLRGSSPQSLGRLAAAAASDPSLRAAASARVPSPVPARAASLVPASNAGVVLSVAPRRPLAPSQAPVAAGPTSHRRASVWALVTALFAAGAVAAGGISYRARGQAVQAAAGAVAVSATAAVPPPVAAEPSAAEVKPTAEPHEEEPLVAGDDTRAQGAGGAALRLERRPHKPRAAAPSVRAPASAPAAPTPGTNPPAVSNGTATSTQPGIDLGY